MFLLMEKKTDHKKIKTLLFFVVLLGILTVLVVLRIYKCPLDYIFGIPCPACGITRAFLSLLKGDIRMAFYYHPLWPVALIAGASFVLYAAGLIHPPKRLINIAGFTLCALLITCFIIRHIQGSPVVRIHFESSLIYRLWNIMKGLS